MLDHLEEKVLTKTALTEFERFVTQYSELRRCLDELVLKGFSADCVGERQKEDTKPQQAKCQAIFTAEELLQHLNKPPSNSGIPQPAASLLVQEPFKAVEKEPGLKLQEQEQTQILREGSLASQEVQCPN